MGFSEGFYKGPNQVSPVLTIFEVRTLEKRPLGGLEGVWKVSWGCLDIYSRCPEDISTQLGVWSVSGGCKKLLKTVLTIWCPFFSFSKG